MEVDALLVPTEVVAHEVYAQLTTPLLWRFLREMPAKGDDWAAELVDRLTDVCGTHLQALWKVRLTAARGAGARPAGWPPGTARLGDLLRNPEDRDEPLHAVPLLVLRGDEAMLAPGRRLRAGRPATSCCSPAGRPPAGRWAPPCWSTPCREYVVTGRHVPSSWIWRRLTGRARRRPVGGTDSGRCLPRGSAHIPPMRLHRNELHSADRVMRQAR